MMDLEWRRWNSANYKLRHDEAIEMADIMMLKALSLARKTGILVLGPSFEREAELVSKPAVQPRCRQTESQTQ